MSYILDALRKADSERERGSVPTLHSHAEHEHAGGRPGRSGTVAADWPPALRWALAAAAVVLLLLLGAWAARWGAVDSAPAGSVAIPPAPAATLPPPAAMAAKPTLASQAPAPLTPVLLAPPPAAVEPLPAAKPLAGGAPSSAVQAPAISSSSPIAQPNPSAPAILKFADLPDATRKALPTIATSGAMYSDTPANRMLIVNGQLLHEGEQIAPELLLERIELKSAVLVFKGQRFRISY
ncbi:general secretion pathway protein GspB [Roseateles albus]|uniref:General secretion pathway protein GspB n=1 Tax=Roseateles albus TaxID=2987525 RepID=A0ABT5K9L6_9BURK|nr:general secretion pathway protein GspB [Roseateles albus]MDC8770470.1 general secretion pathway protein GspB [Roseateles albus]